MDKNQIIKTIKKKTRGVYSEKFYSDLADEILGTSNTKYQDENTNQIMFLDYLLSEQRYYSVEFVESFNKALNLNYSPKKVLMTVKDYVDHFGHVIEYGKSTKGRYFIITRFEPK
jgi:hypothetical protein